MTYIRGQLLKKGDYGSDYLGMSKETGIFIRVREIKERDGATLAELERILGALLTKSLSHKNLVAYLDYERRESSLNLLSEYVISVGDCDGSIAFYIREYGRVEETIIRSFINQTVQGLVYLHDKGISHGSLSTSNLLLEPDGTIKIADFGTPIAAKSFDSTPTFTGLESAGNEADIGSLGAIVIEMFCGSPHWNQDSLDIMDEKPLQNVPISQKAWAEISPQGQRFIRDCCTIDPLRRPTASNLLSHPFCIVDSGYRFPKTELYKKVVGLYSEEDTKLAVSTSESEGIS